MFALDSAAFAWLAVAVFAAIVEVSIPHFGLAFVGVGAMAAAVSAFMDFGVAAQFGAFVVALSVSLLALRPRLIARLGGRGVPSRTDTLIGRHGIVTQEIDHTVGSGRVNVSGEDWAARSSESIPVGVKVRVVAADGIVLEVTRV